MSERPRDAAFEKRLKDLLVSKGIKNNNQFSRAINKAPAVTLKWLKGKVPGSPGDVKLLCDFFNVSADYLVFGKDFEENEGPSRIVLQLPKEARGFVFILEDPDREGDRR